MVNPRVDIGVLEEKENWLLHPRFFPSKVGGKPAWLDLEHLPEPENLICKICKEPMIYLCQVYAPYEESSDCFHRTNFIFICKNGACCRLNSSDNFLVLRCQLPRINDYYSSEPYEEIEGELFCIKKWCKLCDLCGAKAPSHCSKCKKVNYCSRKHQVLDWKKGHKDQCISLKDRDENISNNFTVTEAGKSFLFKEWSLEVDEEEQEDPKNINTNEEMNKLFKLIQEKKVGTMNNTTESELEQYVGKVPEDKIFNKFSKRVARHPDQVLRYDRGGQPLWITSTSNSIIHIPKCQYCNGERQFEFQIMPQLLNFIDVGVDLHSVDWGVLVVYTLFFFHILQINRSLNHLIH